MKKLGKDYMKYSNQIYKLEEDIQNIQIGNVKPIAKKNKTKPQKKKEVKLDDSDGENEGPEPLDENTLTEKEKIQVSIMRLSGQIKAIKKLIEYEKYPPAIDKLNKEIDQLKTKQKLLNDDLLLLKNK